MGGSPSFLCFSLCFSLLYLCSSLLLSRSSLLLPCLTPHTSHTLPVGLVGMLREVGGSPIRSWHLERRPPKGFGARSDTSFLFLFSSLTTLDAYMTLMTFYFILFHILPFVLTHGKPCVILVASRLSDVPTFPRFVGIFVQLPPSYISR